MTILMICVGADRNRTLGPQGPFLRVRYPGKTMIRASLFNSGFGLCHGRRPHGGIRSKPSTSLGRGLERDFCPRVHRRTVPLGLTLAWATFSSYCFLGSLRFAALTMSLSSESEDNGSPIGSRRRASGLSSTTCSLSTTRGTAWRTNWSVSGPWWSCAEGISAFSFMPSASWVRPWFVHGSIEP